MQEGWREGGSGEERGEQAGGADTRLDRRPNLGYASQVPNPCERPNVVWMQLWLHWATSFVYDKRYKI